MPGSARRLARVLCFLGTGAMAEIATRLIGIATIKHRLDRDPVAPCRTTMAGRTPANKGQKNPLQILTLR
jgi:hypothetical protein